MNTPFTFGSLFAGIGGIDLGLERAGMRCEWQVEIDEYATKVLAKHWPDVARFRDIRECGAHNLTSVDLICGGFPCQDISQAKTINVRGLDGERSGLWKEFYRIICELRPRYVLVENVSALLHRGIDRILGCLAQSGYDAEWQVLSAAQFGAPHLRRRVFIVAYTKQNGLYPIFTSNLSSRPSYPLWGQSERASKNLDTLWSYLSQFEERLGEPSIFGSNDGLPYWLDRLGCIGNAVVPQIAEYIGNCILASAVEEAV